MIKEKKQKKVFSWGIMIPCLALFISIFAFPTNVKAKDIFADEIESNDTRLQAQEIQENKSVPEGYYNTDLGGTYQMTGNSSTIDEDWFKVYLTKGLKYFTCGDKAFVYHVEDEVGNTIDDGVYNEAERVFNMEIPANGTYYIRIKGTTAEQTKYLFYLGSPVWAHGSVVMTCNPTTIKMTSGSKTGIFDSSNLNLPKDAIVAFFYFNNVRTNSVKSITMTNHQSGTKINMDQFTWEKNNLETQHLPASTMWSATFGYSKTISFNPTVKMYYLYPRYQ